MNGISPPASSISSRKSGRRSPFDGLTRGQVLYHAPLDIDPQAVPRFDHLMYAGHFEQRKPDLVAVAVEGTRKELSHDAADAGGLERLCRQCAPGGAAEVAAGDDDVAWLDVLREIGIGRFENVLGHFFGTLPHDVGGGDQVGGNIVAKLPAGAFEDEFV